MSLLHTISSSHLNLNIELLNSDDAVLFWQDGVILSLKSSSLLTDIHTKTTQLYALDLDLKARGLDELVSDSITIVTLDQVVKLTEQYYPQIAW